MRDRLYILLAITLLIVHIAGLVHDITTPPTFDFVVLCKYADDYTVNVHRGLCPERESELITWKLFGHISSWESTWEAYLAPYSAGSPYYMWDYGNDSHLEHLIKEAFFQMMH